MQSSVSIEQEIFDAVRALPADRQQEVLDFVEFLHQKIASNRFEGRLSLQEIACLPILERHKILEKYIPTMAKDFASDPTLTEFSDLDMDDWNADHVES